MQNYQRRLAKPVSGASFRSEQPLTNDQIRAVAPSIFAVEKHESRSDRYTCIPTVKILDGLRDEGFLPFFVAQSNTKDEGKRSFARHMVRLRHAGQINAEETNEIIIINSADGTSGAQILAGIFKEACANGCVVGSVLQDIRVRHTGNIVDDVIEGSYRILKDFSKVNESMEEMKSIQMLNDEQLAFARSALSLKYDNPAQAPIKAEQLLLSKRRQDNGEDLWTTMQKVQEHLIRGGVVGRTAKGLRTKTRAVNSITENTKLNQAIWSLGEAMKQLKTGRELEVA